MEKLGKIPSVSLVDDGWKYECKAFEDVVTIAYFEGEKDAMKEVSSFEIPTCHAKQVLQEMILLVDMRYND